MYVLVKTNKYHGTYVSIVGIVHDMQTGMVWFDTKHKHEGRFCDYCRGTWDIDTWRAIKFVDHDGAGVYYEVRKVPVRY